MQQSKRRKQYVLNIRMEDFMSREKENFYNLASMFLSVQSFFDVFSEASEYVDAIPNKNGLCLDDGKIAEQCIELSSDLQVMVADYQPFLMEVGNRFAKSLQSILNQSKDVQIDFLGAVFDIQDFDLFEECYLENLPSYVQLHSANIASVVIDWLSRSYHQYLEEDNN